MRCLLAWMYNNRTIRKPQPLSPRIRRKLRPPPTLLQSLPNHPPIQIRSQRCTVRIRSFPCPQRERGPTSSPIARGVRASVKLRQKPPNPNPHPLQNRFRPNRINNLNQRIPSKLLTKRRKLTLRNLHLPANLHYRIPKYSPLSTKLIHLMPLQLPSNQKHSRLIKRPNLLPPNRRRIRFLNLRPKPANHNPFRRRRIPCPQISQHRSPIRSPFGNI